MVKMVKNRKKRPTIPDKVYSYVQDKTIAIADGNHRFVSLINVSTFVAGLNLDGLKPDFRQYMLKILHAYTTTDNTVVGELDIYRIDAEAGATFTDGDRSETNDVITNFDACLDKPFTVERLGSIVVDEFIFRPMNAANGTTYTRSRKGKSFNLLPVARSVAKTEEDPLWNAHSPEVFIAVVGKCKTTATFYIDFVLNYAYNTVRRPMVKM